MIENQMIEQIKIITELYNKPGFGDSPQNPDFCYKMTYGKGLLQLYKDKRGIKYGEEENSRKNIVNSFIFSRNIINIL